MLADGLTHGGTDDDVLYDAVLMPDFGRPTKLSIRTNPTAAPTLEETTANSAFAAGT